ncbi:single-stranded-DNA-specific exonuclease RecJ [uncultured Ruthenibacterium sp.]|uniref:single-stranded-DNA-specific exonuclease RecJ n=1 Tax=uncultured Ruthenibacterium sp. TaxID=1905347 RepID=UPI00349E4EC6
MIYHPWRVSHPDSQTAALLSQSVGQPLLVGKVLAARGVVEPQDAQLKCGAGQTIGDPLLMCGMEQAVARIHRAMDDGERIVVFGDYDVDGVTATALLYTYLDACGAEVYYKLPSRDEDGYGLSESAVDQMAEKGVNLIITVDNGISAHEAVARAAQRGMDVVITDHHLPPQNLPDAVAVIDPQLPNDKSSCKVLSGAGVAFKLICALDGAQPFEMLPYYGDLAAIGTVADIMSLTGENRTIVKAGLSFLQNTDRPGLAALIAKCGLENKELTAENVSFGLAPRLNAAGRMDSATVALRLLLSDDEEEAEELAQELDEKNAARQKAEQEISQVVIDRISSDPEYQADRILVVWGEGFHPGVIGIVASRIADRFGKPAIVVSVDENGEGKGSGRSREGISLYDAIFACSELLIRFGGHASAAGLSIEKENLPEFRRMINQWAAEHHPVMQVPPISVDTPVNLSELTEENVAALSVLAPFGNGNPAPLFLVESVSIEAVYPVSEGKHSRIRFRQGANTLNAVLFGKGPNTLGYGAGDVVDVILSLSIFDGRNGPMISARIRDMRPAGMNEEHAELAQWAEAFCSGAILDSEKARKITPVRTDTVGVYRFLAAHPQGVAADDLRPLFAKLGQESAGKVLISLKALEQLSLAEQRQGRWYIVPAAKKKDLFSAPVLQKLEG